MNKIKKEVLKKEIIAMAEHQLSSFVAFERSRGITVTERELLIWVGAYVSAISRYYQLIIQPKTEALLRFELESITQNIASGETAKSVGLEGFTTRDVTSENIANK